MITERLMAAGSWSLNLVPETPGAILDKLDIRVSGFGHIVVLPTHIDRSALSDPALLGLARYTGVYRRQDNRFTISGAGVNTWMGDEDGKGLLPTAPTTGTTWATWVTNWRPSFLGAGISPAAGGSSFTKTYSLVPAGTVMNEVCAFFGGEWRVTNDFKLDVGTLAQLYRTTPQALIVRRVGDSGRDPKVVGIPGSLDLSRDVEDWYRTALMYYNNGASSTIVDGAIADINVKYRWPNGNAAQIRKTLTNSTTVLAEARAAAAADFTPANAGHTEMRLSSDVYDIGQDVAVGDAIWVYDPDMGIADTANKVDYRGQTIYPEQIRCVGMTWPVRNGMGVYFRRHVWNPATSAWDLEWTDLTDYTDWETGATTVELSSLPRKLK